MLTQRIVDHVTRHPRCTELDIARSVIGQGAVQQQVNPAIRRLVKLGVLTRDLAHRPFTYTIGTESINTSLPQKSEDLGDYPTEDQIKAILLKHLTQKGFRVRVAMGNERGIDIEAQSAEVRWIIEVKGPGARPQMRVNFFISVLGELLQRMDSVEAQYSIAFPDMPQYRRLWDRLPQLAKTRTGITVLFVDCQGNISHGDISAS